MTHVSRSARRLLRLIRLQAPRQLILAELSILARCLLVGGAA